MTTHRLLTEFLTQDCVAAAGQKLLAEIAKHGATRVDVVREFNLNRFNVHLDFEVGEVRIEDEMDTSEQGSFSLSLAEFTAALNSHKPQR